MTPEPQKREPSSRTCQRSLPARPVARLGYLAFRLAGGDVLVGEEDVGGPADRLGLGVAEQPLGARVPTRDPPVRSYRDDSVFGGALDGDRARKGPAERSVRPDDTVLELEDALRADRLLDSRPDMRLVVRVDVDVEPVGVRALGIGQDAAAG
jgi:hypothetical protein